MRIAAVFLLTVLAGTAFGAVNKDGRAPSVNPCGAARDACAGEDPQAMAKGEPGGVTEPVVIFLDADGNTLVRVPISRFREMEPDAKLPPELDKLK